MGTVEYASGLGQFVDVTDIINITYITYIDKTEAAAAAAAREHHPVYFLSPPKHDILGLSFVFITTPCNILFLSFSSLHTDAKTHSP